MTEPAYGEQARQLRESFDRVFALPHRQEEKDHEKLLLLRVGTEMYAVKTREIAGLLAGKKIAPVPSRVPAYLGLAGIKGSLFPVWSLNVLLGQPPPKGDPRWLLLGTGGAPWALSFDDFERFAAVPRSEIHPPSADGAQGEHIREVCLVDGRALPVVSLGSVLEDIKKHS